jgi:hypothetical protein
MMLPSGVRFRVSRTSNDVQSNTDSSMMTPQPSSNPFTPRTPYRLQDHDYLNLVPCISPSLSSSPVSINDEIGSVMEEIFEGPRPREGEILLHQHQTGRMEGKISLRSGKFRLKRRKLRPLDDDAAFDDGDENVRIALKMRKPCTLDDDAAFDDGDESVRIRIAAVTLSEMKSSRKRPPAIKRDSLSLIKVKRMPQFDDDEPHFGQQSDRDEFRDQQADHHHLCVLDPRYPRRLAISMDYEVLNSRHCLVRKSLLEFFSQEDGSFEAGSEEKSEASSSGRIGLRCAYCSHIPKRFRSKMSSFYPLTIEALYRQVCAWQRIHFGACEHVPIEVRDEYNNLKESDKTRGKTPYWASSARDIGLINMEPKGICFQL